MEIRFLISFIIIILTLEELLLNLLGPDVRELDEPVGANPVSGGDLVLHQVEKEGTGEGEDPLVPALVFGPEGAGGFPGSQVVLDVFGLDDGGVFAGGEAPPDHDYIYGNKK